MSSDCYFLFYFILESVGVNVVVERRKYQRSTNWSCYVSKKSNVYMPSYLCRLVNVALRNVQLRRTSVLNDLSRSYNSYQEVIFVFKDNDILSIKKLPLNIWLIAANVLIFLRQLLISLALKNCFNSIIIYQPPIPKWAPTIGYMQ